MRLTVFIAATIALCASSARAAVVNFEDLAPSTQYGAGATFTTGGADARILPFFFSGGGTTTNFARVSTGGMAGGTGNELTVNNVNVGFDFNDVPFTNAIALQFGEYGGNVNLEINGDQRNVLNFSALDGMTVGGATVEVVAGPPNAPLGSLFILSPGPINSFSIGGQELWIDNLISSCIPEPATLSLLALTTIPLLARRRAR
jgi:hypothetical protein